ncbi:hypothetical protein EDB83DRAFT_2327301 [Lactarius deliciosus]|nr:hypothetical protein EDB83DRAFT_2327301 [Lactarius deliciosus]
MVVDDGLVSDVKTGVVGVEGEVGVDEVDKLVIVGEDLVKLVELVEVVFDVDELYWLKRISLTEEIKIEEDDELEAIKLESEETCGDGVGEVEGLGDGVEEVGTVAVGIACGRVIIITHSTAVRRRRVRWHQRRCGLWCCVDRDLLQRGKVEVKRVCMGVPVWAWEAFPTYTLSNGSPFFEPTRHTPILHKGPPLLLPPQLLGHQPRSVHLLQEFTRHCPHRPEIVEYCSFNLQRANIYHNFPGKTPAVIDITEAAAHVGPQLRHCPSAPCSPVPMQAASDDGKATMATAIMRFRAKLGGCSTLGHRYSYHRLPFSWLIQFELPFTREVETVNHGLGITWEFLRRLHHYPPSSAAMCSDNNHGYNRTATATTMTVRCSAVKAMMMMTMMVQHGDSDDDERATPVSKVQSSPDRVHTNSANGEPRTGPASWARHRTPDQTGPGVQSSAVQVQTPIRTAPRHP